MIKPLANGRNIVGQQLPTWSCCVRLHLAKILTGFKLCTATPNNMSDKARQGAQTNATCNIQQC